MPLISRKSILLLSTFILIIAAGLRLAQVGDVPPGLHYDEAADTIIAREIAEGRSAPIFVAAYTGKEVLFFYWAAAWMKLIGATPFAMRLAAAMMGVLTVAATFRAVREIFTVHRGASTTVVAVLAAAFLATSFWHVLMSRLGFRSIAEPFVQALALAALWRGLRLNRRRWLIASGALVGLNLYTYLAARLFPVAVALLFVYLFISDTGRRRERLVQFGLVVAVAIVVFAPLGLYFLQNPDAFLTRITQVGPREGQSIELWTNVARALGIFFVDGDPYIRFNLPARPLFPLILGILFVIGVLVALIGIFRGRSLLRRTAYFFLLTSTLVMLLPTALAVNEITPSNLRAIGMMPMVFAFPALGAWVLLKGVIRLGQRVKTSIPRPSPFILSIVCLVTALVGLETGLAYFNQYVRSPQLYYESDGDLVDIAERLNAMDAAQTPIYIHALHYRHPTLAALTIDFHNVRSITGPDVLVFPEGASLQVFAHLALPDSTWIERLLPASAQIDVVAGPDGETSYEWIRIDSLPALQPHTRLDANFGDTIELIGYDLEASPMSGDAVDVTLFWRVLRAPDRGDYATFAELRDVQGFQWGQTDSFDYPSEQWTAGEQIVERLRVPIAPGAPPSNYRLDVGWYSAGANRRLPIVTADGGFGGTTAAVAPITIRRAASQPSPDALGIGTRLDAQAADGLTLLGASIETQLVPQGAPLFFTLFWRADDSLPDQPVEVRMSAPGGASYLLSAAAPAHDTYPFDEWSPGEVVADRYGLSAPVDAPPGDYTLEVRVGADSWVAFGSVRVEKTQRRFDVPPIAHPIDATFGDQIRLLGYDFDQAGGSIQLTLYWQALTTPDADYTVFTHLLDASGVQRGGKDNPPVNGTYNTSRWIEGEVIVDAYDIALDPGAPPGEYTVEVGLYRFETGARLPLSIGGDALRLTTIQMGP